MKHDSQPSSVQLMEYGASSIVRWAVRALPWMAVIAGGVLGSATMIYAIFGATTAMQQAALAAIATGLPVIPYCMARALTEMGK